MSQPLAPFLPKVAPAHYDRNFLQQVVCELKFPTLFDFAEGKPPAAFAAGMRKLFPHYQLMTDVQVTGSNVSSTTNVHMFRSKTLDWTVTLRSSAITLETNRYDSFERFTEKLRQVIELAAGVIDSDFFTRIGIRYINALPFDNKKMSELSEWVRPDLVRTIVENDLGIVHEYSNRIGGKGDFGSFLLSHGVGYNATTRDPEYMLDFDFSAENIEFEDTMDAITKLHSQQFDMFIWAIGQRAREHLGRSTLKGE